jgi:hypothetical protein
MKPLQLGTSGVTSDIAGNRDLSAFHFHQLDIFRGRHEPKVQPTDKIEADYVGD